MGPVVERLVCATRTQVRLARWSAAPSWVHTLLSRRELRRQLRVVQPDGSVGADLYIVKVRR